MVAALAHLPNSISQDRFSDTAWLRYFDPRAAVKAVAAHVETLPGSRTAERHTYRAYSDGLNYFLKWSGNGMPTEDLLGAFIAHLVTDRGLKASTISSKYLAPIRLYLQKLAGQRITGFEGIERDYIADCRDHIRAAAAVKSPRAETTTNIAPLWNPQFHRLTLQQVNATLRGCDLKTKLGLRDYALLHVAFSSGLRLAELQRITLNSVTQQGEVILITVRGKRSNVDPVPISARAHADILAYVDAYNDGLDEDDARRIERDTPLWQPLLHGDNYAHHGVNGYTAARGLSAQGIRDIIARRTVQALGEAFKLAAHDTRRTAAAIAYDSGMPLPDIQALLRHKDAAVTLRYVGTKPDFGTRSLANYVQFG